MKEHLKKEILKFHPEFDLGSLDDGMDSFELKTFKAKDIILEAGSVCENLYFTDKSITRCFYKDQEGVDQTLWMKPEQTFLTEYKSFVHQSPSGFSLQFYEDTNVMCISRAKLLELYKKSNDWALFGNLLTEHVHITLIDVFVNLLANDATRNYQYIEYMFPRFIQVAPLKDIASMLQMSQVSISRIRAGKQVKQ